MTAQITRTSRPIRISLSTFPETRRVIAAGTEVQRTGHVVDGLETVTVNDRWTADVPSTWLVTGAEEA